MDVMVKYIPILGPVLGAMIAATLAFLVSVLTKENKTSEFRQAWIEALRNDAAELLSEFNVLEGVFEVDVPGGLDPEEAQERINVFWKDHRKEYANIGSVCNRVILRLNPSEHKLLIEKVRAYEAGIGKGQSRSAQMSDELLNDFSIVLKKEWGRVKKGEAIFRLSKAIAAFLAIVSFGVLAYGVFKILQSAV